MQAPALGRTPLQEPGQVQQGGRVPIDELVHTGTLHLDDHGLTGGQPRRVGVRDGCGADGVQSKSTKYRSTGAVEFGLELGLHDLLRGRVHPALQVAQLFSEVCWQEILAGRGHLADLDEHHARLFQRSSQRHREEPFRWRRRHLSAGWLTSGPGPDRCDGQWR